MKTSQEAWNNVGNDAKNNIKEFSATLYHLFVVKKIKVDLIVSAGSSGSFMIKLTNLILNQFNIKIPSIIIPIVRFKPINGQAQFEGLDEDKFDNSIFKEDVKNELGNIKSLNTVLFVDDEIGEGNSAKSCLDLLLNFVKIKNYIITAENQGFPIKKDWRKNYHNINFEYYPFSNVKEHVLNVITYNVPWEIQEKIKSILPKLYSKLYTNLLLEAPIKEHVNQKPEFTLKYSEILKKELKNFNTIQTEYLYYLNELIKTGINEFKQGKLKPYFLK